MARARFPVAVFALWLGATLTVPVCCVTTSTMAAMDHAGSASMTGMAGHHHHHSSAAAFDPSTLRLSASESCTQNCDAPAVAAVESRMSLKADDHLAASICNVASSSLALRAPSNLQSAIYHRQLSPPGHTPDFSVPLRI
jgi:hypothetical protein